MSDTNPFRYCGEYYDGETGTLYLRARYYDPRIGRFTQEDPVGAGLNWYTYCNGNPIGFFDPWGLAAVNIVDYAKAMGGTVEYYTNNDGKQCVHVTANGVTQSYTYYNSGNIDDTVLNARFGWDSFLTEADRAIEVGIYIFHGDLLKDFTIPINAALDITTAEANRRSQDFFGTGPLDYIWFILQVAPDADWDIKRPDSWNRTIGKNTYPGFGVQVWYQNWVMKPEELGNYTYGYIGAGLNLSLDMLYTGSFWAAGGPLLIFDIDKFIDEMYTDRHMIRRGFNRYHGK
ncbi:MAG: polymorphic toxin type 44 domain-containing protein [Oscillospiraceae bacterium]|nr:polymorphic toxin type 44 domain-containing protein [Oscillospiraceae bacterium]